MTDENLILTLAKVLIAAAWADGELDFDEITSMKDLLSRIPSLTARQWDSIEIYIAAPVGEAARNRLVAELAEAISTPENKELALAALDDMLAAEENIAPVEAAAIAEIKTAITDISLGTFGSLSRLMRGKTQSHAQASKDAPNRENHFDDFVRNRVYYDLKRRMAAENIVTDIPDEQLRKLGLAGGLMANIARISPKLTTAEYDTIVSLLQAHWHLERTEALFVADVAVSEAADDLDYFLLARRFAGFCSYDERKEFVQMLFAVAAADGEANYDEEEEIRVIANTLSLSSEDFIAAKKQVLDI